MLGHGAPGVIIYNAVMGAPDRLLSSTAAHLQTAYSVDVIGAIVVAQAAAPAMRAAGSGTILVTGGGFADHPIPALATVSLGKAALRSAATMLGADLEPDGIRVATLTIAGQIAAGTPFDPDRIAGRYWEVVHTGRPMAGRIPVHRPVGDVLRTRPGKADRDICTSLSQGAFGSLPPATEQLDDRYAHPPRLPHLHHARVVGYRPRRAHRLMAASRDQPWLMACDRYPPFGAAGGSSMIISQGTQIGFDLGVNTRLAGPIVVVTALLVVVGAVVAPAALIARMLVPLALFGHAQLLYQPVRPSGRVAATTKMTAPARK